MQIHYPNTILKSIIKYYKKNYAASVFDVGQLLVELTYSKLVLAVCVSILRSRYEVCVCVCVAAAAAHSRPPPPRETRLLCYKGSLTCFV